ncbi:hypothetical protein [Ferrovibrio terrae]|uniref:hypothetical protein n=1 Tax=Ferrovibrio terrae TaxID=2594003 RepID=UPI003138219A
MTARRRITGNGMMDQYTQAALNGSLVSPNWNNSAGGIRLSLDNKLPVPLYLYGVTTTGTQSVNLSLDGSGEPLLFPAGESTPFIMYNNSFFIVRTAFSGAFVTLLYNQKGWSTATVTIDASLLLPPNQIGLYPEPNPVMPIPPDSPRVLVGVGTTPTTPPNVIVREQFWQRAGDSYLLAPGTKRTVSTTLISGMQNTSSEQDAVSKSLGLSGSFGWGPVSASLSANLSSSSTSFQQVSVSTESTQYESLELNNTTKHTQMFLRWQLTDVITVFQTYTPSQSMTEAAPVTGFPPPANGPGGMMPVTSITQVQSPIMISRDYKPGSLPAPPPPPPPPTTSINMGSETYTASGLGAAALAKRPKPRARRQV